MEEEKIPELREENDTPQAVSEPAEPILENSAPAAPSEPASDALQESEETKSLADSVRIISPLKLVLKRFFRSKLSVVGLCLFIAIFLFSFLGPVFVHWGESEVDRNGNTPVPSILEYVVEDGNGGESYSVYTVKFLSSDENTHAGAMSTSVDKETGETYTHVLGTDKEGRDIFVRLMYGGRLSLILSFLVVLLYTALGVIFGGLAGYFGGWVDMIIMRIVDILDCIPGLPLLMIIGVLYRDGLQGPQAFQIYFMMGCLALISWTGVARLVRGQILFLREQEYIVAAEALGMSPMRKLFHHLVPNVMPQLIVSMTLGLGGMILYEATLSYIGLGVAPEMASWGQMVQLGSTSMELLTVYIADWLPAGILIVMAVLAFNFIGDGLRDALDPKMKR